MVISIKRNVDVLRKIVLSTIALTSLVAVSACGETPATPGAAEAPAEPEPEIEVAFADVTGDAAAGENVYGKCRACHLLEEGRNAMGPSLFGVIGRKAGSIEDFNYSEANANNDITWTPEVLFDYLRSPGDYMPGTRMAFPGIKDAQDRADLVAFLTAQGE